ncbi:androgen-dependent TFPI-regulating protein isoform X3 [Vombatus ursinus]|uniref:androgen-dependent TFPI-regulating protein isoform X3 n=1 Tax=Vombatus ursinus TaxID=29139 RepID=UPI000FFD045A|nr:androgen-dependent TFPI-regulating protein isoform X3 [Vombatus ursinus]
MESQHNRGDKELTLELRRPEFKSCKFRPLSKMLIFKGGANLLWKKKFLTGSYPTLREPQGREFLPPLNLPSTAWTPLAMVLGPGATFAWKHHPSSAHLAQAEQQLSQMFLYGGQWKYLTVLNLLLQAIFYGVACLDDVLKGMRRNKDIKWITASRDLLFTTLAFPVSAFVFMSFWTIFLYDQELIYPKSLDAIFPKWLNHAMHTAVLPFSLIEAILNPHRYPSKKKGLTLLGCAAIAYICWVLRIYYVTKKWVYPIFAQLSPEGLAAFFSVSYVLLACIYLLGERFNQLIWGDQVQQLIKRK